MTLKPSAGRAELKWTKSDGPSCVEVAATVKTIHVRDSKDTDGPQLGFVPETWERFLGSVGHYPQH